MDIKLIKNAYEQWVNALYITVKEKIFNHQFQAFFSP